MNDHQAWHRQHMSECANFIVGFDLCRESVNKIKPDLVRVRILQTY